MVNRTSNMGLGVSLSIVLSLCLVLLSEYVVGQIQTKSRTHMSDRAALLKLRSSLSLKSKDWPVKGDPCTGWKGIHCENGTVVGINISGFHRTRIGKKTPQFAIDPLYNLTHLVYFNASGFLLPGTVPQRLGLRLLALKVLDLSSCSINGALPFSLGNLVNLKTLNLSGNSLTGVLPSSLEQLSNLSELDLSRNSLTGPLPMIYGSLKHLSSLDVSSNYLTGSIPTSIGTLSKLRYLNFSNNSFSNRIPTDIGNLTNLVELDLGFNAFSGPLPKDLFDAQSRLQTLILRFNAFSGNVPDNLWLLPALRILDISENNFTGTLPNSSFGPNLASSKLDISQNMFYGNLTPVLRRFQTMNLSGNYFRGEVPHYVLTANASLTGNCLQPEKTQKTATACSSFYASRGLIFDDSGTLPPPTKGSSSRLSRKAIIILAAVAGGIGLVLIFLVLPVLVALCIRRRRRRGGMAKRGNSVRPDPAVKDQIPLERDRVIDLSRIGNVYTYEQILRATEEFNEANLIKRGHSGDLYNGFMENGIPVVIKMIDNRNEGGYVSELKVFSKAAHHRLALLLGHCIENDNQKFLVYKYMRNGDMATLLHRKSNDDDDDDDDMFRSLDWITRLKIALGVAEGLSYLHHECSPPLVHRDVQASSILLDDKYEVRLGSLSEACGQGDDTSQNSISRFLRLQSSSESGSSGSSTATCAYDVYCFGKVLLELVTGKIGISSPENPQQTKEWLEEILPYISTSEKELVNKIMDPSLIVDEDLVEEVWAMAIIAKSCLNPKPWRRPLMRHVVIALENPLKLVRQNSGLSRLRTNSSKGSWNAAIFGSWNQSSSGGSSGMKKMGSQGSRRHSNEIVPEPSYIQENV